MNIKATNIELTDSIRAYVNKKLATLDKFFKNKDLTIYVEVGKMTKHHNKGEFYKAEFDITVDGERYYTSAEKEDLYLAIDDVR
ncbi:MAG: ribosome-associated translation inhibitor RaiA, partial [Patescibacteria group bacterium]|nr:ribosome-associated translation inhibitor RaiA [Patescibacteria group bacterium]